MRSLKRAIIPFFLSLCVLFTAVLMPSSALYNDVTFETYANLSVNSPVPSLFRNDSVFDSYKSYPPVIYDGIEYVPLEIFYGLSGVKISWSDDSANFYIQNKKSNKYISFSVEGNYAVTGDGHAYEVLVPTYYNVHYVPLRVVCNATGIGCSSYNDGINKIYVIKVYTVPGLSAQELIKIHAPHLYEVKNPEPTVENPSPPPEKPEPPTPPTPEKPAPEPFPPRTVYLMFSGDSLSAAPQTLDTLKRLGLHGVFAIKPQDVYKYSDTVRRIITEGHTLCMELTVDEELFEGDTLERRAKEFRDALYDVSVTGTRLVLTSRSPALAGSRYTDNKIEERLEALGLATLSINTELSDVSSYSARSTLETRLKSLSGNARYHVNAYARLGHTDGGIQAIYAVYELSRTERGVRIGTVTQATKQ